MRVPPGIERGRRLDDDFKVEAAQLLLDGHSAQSIVDLLGGSGTNLLGRWKNQRLKKSVRGQSARAGRLMKRHYDP
jgi:transposase-like protein